MQIYIINLPSSVERRAYIAQQLTSLGLSDYQFSEAIDGRTLTSAPGCNAERRLLKKGYPFNPGEIGVFLSHRRLWQRCVDEGQPIVVLEDDVAILPGFAQALGQLQAQIGELGLVRLGYHEGRKHIIFEDLERFECRLSRRIMGSWGYALSPKAAQALLDGSHDWSDPVDDYMDHSWRHGVLNWVLKAPVVSERRDLFASDIGDRLKPKVSALAKLRQEYYRAYCQVVNFVSTKLMKRQAKHRLR